MGQLREALELLREITDPYENGNRNPEMRRAEQSPESSMKSSTAVARRAVTAAPTHGVCMDQFTVGIGRVLTTDCAVRHGWQGCGQAHGTVSLSASQPVVRWWVTPM